MRLSAAARKAQDREALKVLLGDMVQLKLEPVVDHVTQLQKSVTESIGEVIKLKAQVLALKQDQQTKFASQQGHLTEMITQQSVSFLSQKERLVAMSEELASLRAGLKLE